MTTSSSRDMRVSVLASVQRWVRSVAHDLLYYRDGLSGWKKKRDGFLVGLNKSGRVRAADVDAKLREILAHAFETVPYYRETWQEAGVDPSMFNETTDLKHFPCVTKEIVRDQRTLLLSKSFTESELDLDYTSGTTGIHTTFYRNHECTLSRVGHHWGILGLCGYHPGMKRALVWGVNADLPGERSHGTIKGWFRKFSRGHEALPCGVMTESDMARYHQSLLRFRPDVLYGYPGAIEQLGRHIRERQLQPIRVNSIITTAERLTNRQRTLAEQVFGGEVFNLYATREYGIVGFECKAHNGFHIDAESVFVEITKDGQPLPPGEIGEITITDLLNRGMPFIRSRTGDLGVLSPKPCPCGSSLPLLQSLHGRITDVLYRADGSPVAGILLPDLFVDAPGIKAVQFVQKNIREVEVLLVVAETYSKRLEQEGLRRFQEIMGNDMQIRLAHVDQIPRNARSGKHQDVICKVTAEELHALHNAAAV